jgi:hypothetical protein
VALKIKEEDKLQNQWYEEAGKMTEENLPAFVHKLAHDYDHDYGTICHAIAAAAIAAAWAVERGPHGGITGFQAGAIMWQFVQKWMHYSGAMRLLQYDDLLFPQYASKFNTLSPNTWKDIQEKARQHLAEEDKAHPSVVAHWQSIVDGKIPFGLQLGSD